MRLMLAVVLAVSTCSLSADAASRTGFDVSRTIRGDDSRGPFLLGVKELIAGTDSVTVAGIPLERGRDYTLSLKDAAIVLAEPLPRGQTLTFTARRALHLLPPIRRRQPPSDKNPRIVTTGRGRSTRASARRADRASTGETLSVRGVKRLGVSAGTTSEAAFNQSLKLEVSGTLAEGVRVSGFLTDRSLPRQSSGRTRSVRDLDRIHLQVASPTFSAGLGDVDVNFEGTSFSRYERRLQGARFRMRREEGEVELFGAVSEGAWETRRITTQPGYQGPYTLSTQARPIAAGSERLYLNGRRLRRGDGQDYVIDYERGLVTFTPERPITGASRVTAEFQTVDPEGRVRSLGMRGRLATGDDRIRIGTTMIRESRGATGGAIPSPGAAAPGAFLSGVDGAFAPTEGVRVEGEVAWTRSRGKAAASDAAAEPTTGHAARVGLSWESAEAREHTSGPGALRMTGTIRQVDPSFRSFDRIQAVAQEGVWGWEVEGTASEGTVGEVALRYVPTGFAAVGVELGHRTGPLAGQRRGARIDIDAGRPVQAHAAYDRVDRSGGELTRLRVSTSGRIGWWRPTVGFTSESATGTGVRGSRLFYARPPGDLPEGARIREIDVGSVIGSDRLSLTSSLTASRVDQLSDTWADSVREVTHTTQLSATTTSGVQFSGSFGQTARRDRRSGEGTRVVNLGRVRLAYRPGGMFSQQVQYEVSSTGLADRDRVFVSVPDGDGSYVWEDVDDDGEQDAEEFIPDPGGNFEPLYGVSTTFEPVRASSVGLRTVVDFGRGRFALAELLRPLAFEVALESERSGRPDAGVSIDPLSHLAFSDRPGVLAARHSMRSTVHLFRRHRLGSLRVDARQTDDLDRRLSEDGRSRVRGWTFVGKLRPVRGWDVEGRSEVESRSREGNGAFAHAIDGRAWQIRNWVRLAEGWQTGLTIGWGRDAEARRELEARRITVGPEVRRAFRGKGRLTGRFDFTRVSAEAPLPLFLGMADGLRRGDNYRWRLGLDYRLGAYVDAFVTYDGMIRPERPALHIGRMELRATF